MIKNEYINSLVKANKLKYTVDKTIEFGFQIGSKIIGKEKVLIAGPCSVESEEMIVGISLKLKEIGVDALRGGAYKPCTYPVRIPVNGWKEGLQSKGLEYLTSAKKLSGLPIVTEVMDSSKISLISEHTDIFQVGTRNFQNYTLLDALGKQNKPVLLKRGTWGTLDEILGACERIIEGGNTNLAICLRGVVGMPSYRHIFPSTRWAPDLMMIPALKEFTNIPIIYDPSHATGYRNFVLPMSKAAMALDVDGLIVECHPDPEKSISDPDQAITFETLKTIKKLF
jgi:3-deoxy-7-phosphoheptulonate synthase